MILKWHNMVFRHMILSNAILILCLMHLRIVTAVMLQVDVQYHFMVINNQELKSEDIRR